MPRDEFLDKKKQPQNMDVFVQAPVNQTVSQAHEERLDRRLVGEYGYDANALQQENRQIMQRLNAADNSMEMNEQLRRRLRVLDQTKLTRNRAILLFTDKKSSQDSGLMEQIKKQIKKLDQLLRVAMKNGPDEVYQEYDTTIGLLRNYISTKHPTFSEGKRRKAMVQELATSYEEELNRFRCTMERYAGAPNGIPNDMKVPLQVLEGSYLFQNEAQELEEKLDLRQRDFSSITHANGDSDGKRMKQVKEAFTELCQELDGQVETDASARRNKNTDIREAYKKVTDACSAYISSHHPKHAEGKSRLAAVQMLLDRSNLEVRYMASTASSMLKEHPEGVTWKEVYGQVTMMAEECLGARKKMDILMGESPSVSKVISVFSSIQVMTESHPYKHKMLMEVAMTQWMEQHMDKPMMEKLMTEQFLVTHELGKKYREIVKQDVPADFLKKEGDNPKDENIRKDYARLVLTRDPAFLRLQALNGMQQTIAMGLRKDKSPFAKEQQEPGEYYQERFRERQARLVGQDAKDLKEDGEIASLLLKASYKELDTDATKAYERQTDLANQLMAKKNLYAILCRKKDFSQPVYAEDSVEQEQIQKTMLAVQDKAFVPLQRSENRMGSWAKIKNRLNLGYRWFMGATFGAAFTIGMNAYQGAKKLIVEGSRMAQGQEKRRHDMVPGREGEVFEEEQVKKDAYGEDEEVYSDVRRGPLVWEKLTAGDPEDPPEVAIMVEQSQRGTGYAMGEGPLQKIGHAFIGLTYSRYNKMTKRKERYQLRMGFYPGMKTSANTMLAMMNGAMIAGGLSNDSTHGYDIAKRYKVKPGDINKILRASETYADKGYNVISRNCASFVVDMAKVANLSVGDELKATEFTVATGVKSMAVESGMAASKAGYYWTANMMTGEMNKPAMNYMNFGQKKLTKEDIKNYYKTSGSSSVIKKGFSPGNIGEQLRNMEEGELSVGYDEDMSLSVRQIGNQIQAEAQSFLNQVQEILPGFVDTPEDMEVRRRILQSGDEGLLQIMEQKEEPTPDEIRAIHKNLSRDIKILSQYYKERLQSDARVSESFLKLLSMYEAAISFADSFYRYRIGAAAKGDAGSLRYAFQFRPQSVAYNKDDVSIETTMPPGVYEGYLMAGETPAQAIRDYAQYEKYLTSEIELSDEEKKEFGRLSALNELAESFASANRFLLDKDTFDEKDIDYAFHKLPAMECAVGEGEVITGVLVKEMRPSTAYQGVILEQVFGGFGELHLEELTSIEAQAAKTDEYIEKNLTEHQDQMTKILKSFVKDKTDSVKRLVEDFLVILKDACIMPAYDREKEFDETMGMSVLLRMSQGSKTATWLTQAFTKIQEKGNEA